MLFITKYYEGFVKHREPEGTVNNGGAEKLQVRKNRLLFNGR